MRFCRGWGGLTVIGLTANGLPDRVFDPLFEFQRPLNGMPEFRLPATADRKTRDVPLSRALFRVWHCSGRLGKCIVGSRRARWLSPRVPRRPSLQRWRLRIRLRWRSCTRRRLRWSILRLRAIAPLRCVLFTAKKQKNLFQGRQTTDCGLILCLQSCVQNRNCPHPKSEIQV